MSAWPIPDEVVDAFATIGCRCQSPDGYEVQWRPRGSDTWDGGSAGVYRTPEIAAEVEKEFAENGHETRVRPIAYLDGAPSQSREPSASDVDQVPATEAEVLAIVQKYADIAGQQLAALRAENADLRAQLAEFDAAPVTDARIWDEVRDAMVERLADPEHVSDEVRELADELTRIALGEREP